MNFREINDKGRYVAAKFDEGSQTSLAYIQQLMEIPFPVEKEKLHCTIHYSRVKFPWVKPIERRMKVHAKTEIWKTTYGRTLVLVLSGPMAEHLKARHEIGKQYGATYDHDEYKPHITLSYDVGPIYYNWEGDLELTFSEYSEELEENWS